MIKLYGEFTNLNTYINGERSNRFIGAKIKKTNHELALKQLTLKDIVKDYPVKIHFTWYTKNERVDPDNTAFAKKFILDALVEKGILKDDTRKCINGFTDSYGVDKEPYVVIEIETSPPK